jgi:hypothetical protein
MQNTTAFSRVVDLRILTYVAVVVIAGCLARHPASVTTSAVQHPVTTKPTSSRLTFPAVDVHAAVNAFVVHIDVNRDVWHCNDRWPCQANDSVKLGEMTSDGVLRMLWPEPGVIIDLDDTNTFRASGQKMFAKLTADSVLTRSGRFATLLPNETIDTHGHYAVVRPESGVQLTALYALAVSGLMSEATSCLTGYCDPKKFEFVQVP